MANIYGGMFVWAGPGGLALVDHRQLTVRLYPCTVPAFTRPNPKARIITTLAGETSAKVTPNPEPPRGYPPLFFHPQVERWDGGPGSRLSSVSVMGDRRISSPKTAPTISEIGKTGLLHSVEVRSWSQLPAASTPRAGVKILVGSLGLELD
ncbi:hypothetical protein B0T21DRAFT_353609 [Apiosordaria backusii]|uniref:Uncharacterized protein n=1 Tax=Apiosordaria backusii TaxID=314023 RepID=A0AA39ZPW4_9PEZI|nr:hypothetical protein B0T21DRAFT_353609 [Apiosordaria backusii]